MIITLIAHDKNLGVLTLTDYLLDRLGKEHCAVLGSSYLLPNHDKLFEDLKKFSNTPNIIIKLIVPKDKFSNTDPKYPSELDDLSDYVMRIPKYVEEKLNPVPLKVYKGEENPIFETIKEFYTHGRKK